MEEKEGFTVKELQQKSKKYAVEISLSAIFAVSAIFAIIWGASMMVWSIILCMVLAIVGALLPGYTNSITKASMGFIGKQPIVGIVIAVVFIILAIFIPVIPFALLGLSGGKSLVNDCNIGTKNHKHHESKNHQGSDQPPNSQQG